MNSVGQIIESLYIADELLKIDFQLLCMTDFKKYVSF